jgi:hypothetical protein
MLELSELLVAESYSLTSITINGNSNTTVKLLERKLVAIVSRDLNILRVMIGGVNGELGHSRLPSDRPIISMFRINGNRSFSLNTR